MDAARDEPPSLSNASEMQAEWVEEDEPGLTLPSDSYQTEPENYDVLDLVGNGSGKCMQRHGGRSRTETEYKHNTSN
ncbi:hypothetical protein F2Q70_00028404 [Brassica cretica]|uniref:BRX domain-containing protein n=1 Tax=Brassica cretica TaxID=69181 RepID=A0A8S9L529_BRACR|nr:hypothetical protein F2Q70_00028404 [Brassica cretica]